MASLATTLGIWSCRAGRSEIFAVLKRRSKQRNNYLALDEPTASPRFGEAAVGRDEAFEHRHDELGRLSDFATCWAFSGDGGGSVVGGRFGEWAIDRLVEKIVLEDIVALFTDETARNAAVYEDVSQVLGIEINQPCELGDGVRLVPPAADIFSGFDYPWSDPGTRNETPALGCAVRRRASSHATGPCPGARPERHLREASGRYPLLNRSLFVLWFRFRHLSEGGDYGTEDRASGAGELFLCAAA